MTWCSMATKTLTEQLIALAPAEKVAAKVDALVSAVAPLAVKGAYEFAADGLSITVSGLRPIPGGIEMTVKAVHDGKEIPFENPLRIINPPVALRDERNLPVLDVAGAFRRMILDAVGG
jgi:hypothetical protein